MYWKPINTAPLDKEIFLAEIDEENLMDVRNGYWAPCEQTFVLTWKGPAIDWEFNPTHWMELAPLPDRVEDDEEGLTFEKILSAKKNWPKTDDNYLNPWYVIIWRLLWWPFMLLGIFILYISIACSFGLSAAQDFIRGVIGEFDSRDK